MSRGQGQCDVSLPSWAIIIIPSEFWLFPQNKLCFLADCLGKPRYPGSFRVTSRFPYHDGRGREFIRRRRRLDSLYVAKAISSFSCPLTQLTTVITAVTPTLPIIYTRISASDQGHATLEQAQ